MQTGGGYTRTWNSIRNSTVAVLLQFVSLLVGFFSRKIFLDYLGTEVLGLNSTASSLLGFLNIAELGIGAAISVTLYKPIFQEDRKSIKEIVALQGWLYRKIAWFIIIGSAVLMCFFPRIFAKMELPMWYAYATYAVLLFSSLLGYFVNYKQILLSADQKEYKIQFSFRFISIFKLVAQALAVKFLAHPYIWWLALEVLFAITASFFLNKVIYKDYPYLKGSVSDVAELRHKYPDVVTKVKQLFFHKIGGFVLTQTSPIIIYAYASLTLVALYGNYLIITNNLNYLLGAMFAGLGGSVGNMIAEGNRPLILKVFKELFSSRFLAVMVSSICIWFLADPFISVWLGAEYLLDRTTLLLIIILFFLGAMRSVVDTFINSYGLFQDIWSPIAEAVLNLGFSIGLGYFYGLHGILLGVMISQLLIIFTWKPYFLFTKGLKEPVWVYVLLYAKHLLAGAITFFIVRAIIGFIPIDPAAGIWQFLLYASIVFVCCALILGGLLYATEFGMRSFVKRMLTITSLIKE
ncbi:MAG: sugar transporter [Bacteroidales bacterium]|nr:sugar transporter [Bacteroidales bacterium]